MLKKSRIVSISAVVNKERLGGQLIEKEMYPKQLLEDEGRQEFRGRTTTELIYNDQGRNTGILWALWV